VSSGPAEQMSGVRKAAVLAALLGPEKTADLLSRSGVDRERIEAVAAEVAMLSRVDEQARKAVRSEFVRLAKAQGAGLAGRRAAAESPARTPGPQAAGLQLGAPSTVGYDRSGGEESANQWAKFAHNGSRVRGGASLSDYNTRKQMRRSCGSQRLSLDLMRVSIDPAGDMNR